MQYDQRSRLINFGKETYAINQKILEWVLRASPYAMHSAVKLSESNQEAEVYNLIWKGKAYTCGTAKAHTRWCWDTVKGVPPQREISAGPWKKKRTEKVSGQSGWGKRLDFHLKCKMSPSKESLIALTDWLSG